MTRRNPVLEILGNPQGRRLPSESQAWSDVYHHAAQALRFVNALNIRSAINTHLEAIQRIAEHMKEQVESGTHTNPRGALLSRDVLAVVYIHAKDGDRYVHGFGDAALTLKDRRDGTLEIQGLEPSTAVCMHGSADKKTVTLSGADGQPLWDFFREER